jgi:hypothetical protein
MRRGLTLIAILIMSANAFATTSTTYDSNGNMYTTYYHGNSSYTYDSNGNMYTTYYHGRSSDTYDSNGNYYHTTYRD